MASLRDIVRKYFPKKTTTPSSPPSTPTVRLTPSGPQSVSPTPTKSVTTPSGLRNVAGGGGTTTTSGGSSRTSGGGGGSRGGGGSVSTAQQLTDLSSGKTLTTSTGLPSGSKANIGNTQQSVVSFVEQAKREEQLKKLQSQQYSDQVFGSKNKQSTKLGTQIEQFKQGQIEKIEGQQQSVPEPDTEYLAYLRGNLGTRGEKTWRNIPVGAVQEVLPEKLGGESAKISAQDANLALQKIKNREIADFYAKRQTEQIKNITEQSKQEWENFLNSQEYKDRYSALQQQVNEGYDVDKANAEWTAFQESKIKELDNKAKTSYNSWFEDFKNNEAKGFQEEAVRDIVRFNSRYGTPRFNERIDNIKKSFTTGAIVGGTASGVVGGLGLFERTAQAGASIAKGLGAVGSIPVQAAVATGGLLYGINKKIDREEQLINKYGFTKEEALKIANIEFAKGSLAVTETYVSFMGGATIASAVVSASLTPIKRARIETKRQEFMKELNKSPELQKKYLTEDNLKKGYFTKDILGQQVKFRIGDQDRLRILARLQGTITTKDLGAIGEGVKADLINKFAEKNIILQRDAYIGQINQRVYTRITGEQIGKEVKSFIVYEGGQQSGRGFIFNIKSNGRITNIRPFTQTLNPDGTYFINVGKLSSKPVRYQTKGGGIFETYTVKDTKLYAGKGKETFRLKQQNVEILKQDVAVGKVKGKVSKTEFGSQFGKEEPLFEFFQTKGKITTSKPSTLKVTQVGQSIRSSITQDVDIFGGTISKTRFTQATSTRTPDPLIAFTQQGGGGKTGKIGTSNLPPAPKPPKIDINPPSSSKGGLFQLPKADIKADTTMAGLVGEPVVNTKINLLGSPTSEVRTGSLLTTGAFLTGEVEAGKKEKVFVDIKPDSEFKFADFNMIKSDFKVGQSFLNPRPQPQRSGQTQTLMPRFDTTTTPMVTPILQPIRQNFKPIQPIGVPFQPLGFGLGGIEVGGGQRGKETKTGLLGGTKYNPSLGSVLLRRKPIKVSKAKAKELGSLKFTGLELRPEIEIVNGQDKKKKKKKSIFAI